MEEIKNFILDNSYFELDEYEEYSLFTTRRHGILGQDKPGNEDIEEVKRLCKLVNSKFSTVLATWDTCDEWTNLYVDLRNND